MTNVYRIGVQIAMMSNGAQVLGVLARHLTGIHGQVRGLEGGFNKLKLAIGGALAVGAGMAIIGGLDKVLNAGEKLSAEQGKMLAAGLSHKDVAQATAKAWEVSGKVMATAVHENLAAISHLRAVLGDLPEAYRVVEGYQRNAVALEAITGKPGEQQAFMIARAIHMSGAANDPITKKLSADLMSRQMNISVAMIAAGGGKLTANDMFMFQQQAGSFGTLLDDQGRINMVGGMQAQGGRKLGSQFTAANRAIMAGVMPKAVMAEWASAGLLDARHIFSVKGGGFGASSGAVPGGNVLFKDGALTGEALWKTNPYEWVYTVLKPHLEAMGLKTSKEQVNWVNKSKMGIQASRFFAEALSNESVDKQEARNVALAARSNQYDAQMGTNYGLNKKAFHEAWGNLLTAFAQPLLPSAIKAMQSITKGIQDLTAWSVANPEKIAFFGKAAFAIGAGLVVLGGVAVIAAIVMIAGSPIGLAVAGMAAVAAAVAAFTVLNWPEIKKAAHSMLEFFRTFNDVANYIVAHPFKGLTTPTDQLPALAAADKAKHSAGYADRAATAFYFQSRGVPIQSAAPPPTPHPANSNTPGVVMIDGKRAGKIMSPHIAAALGGNNSAVGRHDPGATLASPAAGGRR